MKNLKFKKVYLFIAAMCTFMLHLPFAFSSGKKVVYKPIVPAPLSTKNNAFAFADKMYDSLKLNLCGLSIQAFEYAYKGYDFLKLKGKIANDNILSIVDFSKPSNQKRLFVIDVKNYKVLFNTYVAHGQGSGEAMATNFSNRPESLQSSLGFYTTADTYMGRNGFSLHLQGIEYGINDKAYQRSIVMHGAPYVSENYIFSKGYLGRSWGCPAVPEKLNRPIIETIKNGSCLFIYSENNRYLQQSAIINS